MAEVPISSFRTVDEYEWEIARLLNHLDTGEIMGPNKIHAIRKRMRERVCDLRTQIKRLSRDRA